MQPSTFCPAPVQQPQFQQEPDSCVQLPFSCLHAAGTQNGGRNDGEFRVGSVTVVGLKEEQQRQSDKMAVRQQVVDDLPGNRKRRAVGTPQLSSFSLAPEPNGQRINATVGKFFGMLDLQVTKRTQRRLKAFGRRSGKRKLSGMLLERCMANALPVQSIRLLSLGLTHVVQVVEDRQRFRRYEPALAHIGLAVWPDGLRSDDECIGTGLEINRNTRKSDRPGRLTFRGLEEQMEASPCTRPDRRCSEPALHVGTRFGSIGIDVDYQEPVQSDSVSRAAGGRHSVNDAR